MANVLLCKTFSFENVTEVTVAVLAENLDSKAVCIGLAAHGTFDLIIKAWPTAVAREFVFGQVERSVALPTDIGPRLFVFG